MSNLRLDDMRVKSFPNIDRAVQAIAAEIIILLRRDLDDHETVRLGVSGGRTPAPLYEALSGAELDWHRVHITLVDDRCVSADDPASNLQLVRHVFGRDHAKSAPIIGLWDPHLSREDNERLAHETLSQQNVFSSVAILGMGIDGHIASLFPQADGIAAAMDVNINNKTRAKTIRAKKSAVTGDITDRISMTLPMLLGFKNLILLIQGQDKIDALEAALGPAPGAETPPIRALCEHRPDVTIAHAKS